MEIRQHGIQKYARLIQQNVDQAHYLAGVIQSTPNLELLAPYPSNVVCFRFRPDNCDEESINKLNREILVELHESGVAAPSNTMIRSAFALRVAVTNHRSRRDDFDVLMESTVKIGKELAPKYCYTPIH
jgi:aromatic-L-amino-acid decarboxylase